MKGERTVKENRYRGYYPSGKGRAPFKALDHKYWLRTEVLAPGLYLNICTGCVQPHLDYTFGNSRETLGYELVWRGNLVMSMDGFYREETLQVHVRRALAELKLEL